MGEVVVMKKAKLAAVAAAAALALGLGFTAGTAQAYADEAEADLALTTQMNVPALIGATQAVVAVNGSNTVVVTNNTADQTGTWSVAVDNANVTATISPAKVTVANGKSQATITLKGAVKGTSKLTVKFVTDSGKEATKDITVQVKGRGDRQTIGDITFEVVNDEEGTAKVKTVKAKKSIKVPSKVKMFNRTYIVDYIGNSSFKKAASKITTVTLPKTIKTVGTKAFKDCKKLTSIKGGKATVKIGQSAFQNAVKMKVCEPLTASTKLVKVNTKAAAGCKALPATLTIKSTKLKYFRANALKGASKVKTVVFKSKALTKKGVRGSMKGSSVKTVKVAKKAYKSYFAKKNCGKKVTVKVA